MHRKFALRFSLRKGGKGKKPAEHHASVVAAADYLGDENEEIKFETVSHEIAIAV